ncbi:MAG: diguanylate cyclase [Actinoplanes sp.]
MPRDLLRAVRLLFLIGLVPVTLLSLAQLASRDSPVAIGLAVLGTLVLLRVVEYRRGEPAPPLVDVLELVALGALLWDVRDLDVVIAPTFFLLLTRAAGGHRRRLIPMIVGYVGVYGVLAYLLELDGPFGAFVAMPVVAALVHAMSTLLARRNDDTADLLAGLPTPVLVVDGRGHAVLVNPAAAGLTGSLDELRATTVDGDPVDLRTLAPGRHGLELRLVRGDGREVQVLVDTAPATRGTMVTLTDVTALRAAERQLRQAAHHDALTGLANRSLLYHRFAQVTGMPYAVLRLDLDNVKAVNDTYGYFSGDELLRGVAQRLTQVVGPEATVARLGGDEFAVLLPRADAAAARAIAEAVDSCFRWDFALSTGPVRTAGLIGYALAGPGRHPDEALAAAGAARYPAPVN